MHSPSSLTLQCVARAATQAQVSSTASAICAQLSSLLRKNLREIDQRVIQELPTANSGGSTRGESKHQL